MHQAQFIIDRFTTKRDGRYVHSPLSNFYVAEFRAPWGNDCEELLWPTVEHYYQAYKARYRDEAMDIREAATAAKARQLGRRCDLVSTWEQIKLEVMRTALEYKFAPGSDCAEYLLDTGDALLVEGNDWGDTYWGVCAGVGENWLGWLLMAQRAYLRSL